MHIQVNKDQKEKNLKSDTKEPPVLVGRIGTLVNRRDFSLDLNISSGISYCHQEADSFITVLHTLHVDTLLILNIMTS